MKVFITYSGVWDGKVDQFVITEIVSITTRKLTDDEIIKLLTKHTEADFEGGMLIKKNKEDLYSPHGPEYTAYESEEYATEDDFHYLFFVNRPYELKDNK